MEWLACDGASSCELQIGPGLFPVGIWRAGVTNMAQCNVHIHVPCQRRPAWCHCDEENG